jgi:ubiquinone/menaquinone biosynthesis C-methylase UbiE
MGRLETCLVNSPLRAPFARAEIRRFWQLTGLGEGATLLEIGCGAGLTSRAIIDRFRPSRLAAFDFEESQVERARRRLARVPQVEVRQADATALPYADGEFDAALAIGVLHHIPGWRDALREVARTLRPGGVFCFAEPTRGRLTRGLYRLFPHPPEGLFEREELLEAMREAGLTPQQVERTLLWSIFGAAAKA